MTIWEPWNESNNTGWSNAANYVSEVLAPFYKAVKAAEPGSSSTVLGGTSIGPSVGWWQQLIAAGGLSDMDVAAVHPYTGNDDAFDEDGMQTQVEQLQGILQGKPLWFTELGWFSGGDYDYLSQANNLAQMMIWLKALNIPVWNYFFRRGHVGHRAVLVDPDRRQRRRLREAVGSVHHGRLPQIGNRPYPLDALDGIPQTYQADFGPAAGGQTRLATVWSDGLDVTGAVTLVAPGGGSIPVTVTSQYGNATSVSVTSGTAYSLPLSDQVTYISYPVGDTIAIGPTQGYGTNLATQSDGATATATSGSPSYAINGEPVGGWSSTKGDATPSLTVKLAGTPTINRIVVDTQSVGSTATGVRDYTVSVDEPGSGWTTVSTVRPVSEPRDAAGLRSGGGQRRPDHHLRGQLRWLLRRGSRPGGRPPRSPPPTSTLSRSTPGRDARPGRRERADPADHRQRPGTRSPRSPPAPPGTPGDGGAGAADGPAGGPAVRGVPDDHRRRVGVRLRGAAFYGPAATHLLNRPIVGMASTPDDRATGWSPRTGACSPSETPASSGPLVDCGSTSPSWPWPRPRRQGLQTGRRPPAGISPEVMSLLGSTGNLTLNRPIVGMAPTPDGRATGWSPRRCFNLRHAASRVHREPDLEQAHRGHGLHPRRQGLLAGRLRRGRLHLRGRRFLRVHREPGLGPGPSWPWPPPPTARATGGRLRRGRIHRRRCRLLRVHRRNGTGRAGIAISR